jgi:hypothetical protein
MKKYAIAAVVMVLGASGAFAASLGIPLFIDNADEKAGVPAVLPDSQSRVNVVMGLVTLKNNTAADIECSIQYYNLAGDSLGPVNFADTTFTIRANSSLGFRPVAEDPGKGVVRPSTGVAEATGGGQEGDQGVLVPNRPMNIDTAKTGSITISWTGYAEDIGGTYQQYNTFRHIVNGVPSEFGTFSYGHLLPPGIDN